MIRWGIMEPAHLCNCSDRFWAKVGRRGDDECWPWMAGNTKEGYGRFRVDGKLESAHRVAYALMHGPIPDAKVRRWVIMHTCDNPSCCNPKHLRLGDYSENTADMLAKGRGRTGLKPHNQERVDFIVSDPRPLRKFCAETGIPLSTAGRIRRAAGRAAAPTPTPPRL